MDAMEAILTRRSTRRFRPGLSRELLETVINAGRFAPSGGNSQTSHFIVVTNRKIMAKLADIVQAEFALMETYPGMYRSMAYSINASKNGGYVFHFDAPALIIMANKKDYGNAMADCACALENMMIAANALDLGSCWINQLKWLNENENVLELMYSLGMARDEKVFGALALGHPDTESGLPARSALERTGNRVTFVE